MFPPGVPFEVSGWFLYPDACWGRNGNEQAEQGGLAAGATGPVFSHILEAACRKRSIPPSSGNYIHCWPGGRHRGPETLLRMGAFITATFSAVRLKPESSGSSRCLSSPSKLQHFQVGAIPRDSFLLTASLPMTAAREALGKRSRSIPGPTAAWYHPGHPKQSA